MASLKPRRKPFEKGVVYRTLPGTNAKSTNHVLGSAMCRLLVVSIREVQIVKGLNIRLQWMADEK